MKSNTETTHRPLQISKKNKTKLVWTILPFALISTFILLSFRPAFMAKEVAYLSVKSNSKIALNIAGTALKGVRVQEATISKMEQTDGFYSKILNMSVVDKDGNEVALSLTDVKNGRSGIDVNTGFYFGEEHRKSAQNYFVDLGFAHFSNNSDLIFLDKNGDSVISKNGWIKIDSCKNGKISGSFQFEIEGEEGVVFSDGSFEEVEFLFSS